nr:hypothetical protein [Lentibacillus sp. CBA3610]
MDVELYREKRDVLYCIVGRNEIVRLEILIK